MNKIVLVAAVALAALIGFGVRSPEHAEARNMVPGQRYEYLIVVLRDDQPLILTADREIQIRPPAGRLSGGISNGGLSNTQFTTRSVEKRHSGVAALDLLGLEGWEAFATVPDQNGATTVLMRRPQ